MLKFVMLTALLALAAAKAAPLSSSSASASSSSSSSSSLTPSAATTVLAYNPLYKTALIQEPGHIAIAEPTLAKVGDYVESVPTAVSHQSSTIVHNRANLLRSILAPAVQTRLAPVLRSYVAPVVHHHHGGYPEASVYPLGSYYAEPSYYYGGYTQEQLYKSLA